MGFVVDRFVEKLVLVIVFQESWLGGPTVAVDIQSVEVIVKPQTKYKINILISLLLLMAVFNSWDKGTVPG